MNVTVAVVEKVSESSMIAVYSNNILTDHYIGQLKFGQSYQIYHSIEQYLTADAKIKIAFVNHLNSYEPPDSEELRLYQGIDGCTV
jgi:hypothetical protein